MSVSRKQIYAILSSVKASNSIGRNMELVSTLNDITLDYQIFELYNNTLAIASPDHSKVSNVLKHAVSVSCQYNSYFELKVFKDRYSRLVDSKFAGAKLEDMFPQAIDKINRLKMDEALR